MTVAQVLTVLLSLWGATVPFPQLDPGNGSLETAAGRLVLRSLAHQEPLRCCAVYDHIQLHVCSMHSYSHANEILSLGLEWSDILSSALLCCCFSVVAFLSLFW